MNAYYLSILFNFLLIVAFIIDRLFRIKSVKEYRDARDAQVTLLKEKIDFIEKYNDEYVSGKYKKSIDNLKLLLNDKELEIENNKQSINFIKELQEKYEKEREDYKHLNETFLGQKKILEETNNRLSKEKENLELKITSDIKELQNRNQKLYHYSTYLSHQIRGPIATLKGLVNLNRENLVNNEECILMMNKCLSEIDEKIIETTGSEWSKI